MTVIFAEKRQALEDLLRELEGLRDAVQKDHFEDLDEIAVQQDTIMKRVAALDQKLEQANKPETCGRELAEELKALLSKIAEVNDSMIAMVTMRVQIIQQELGTLHRGAVATAGYRRQANAKI